MAPKKAAKKVAKKAAKKTAGNRLAQDTRRCYEHFGRVSALLPLLGQTGTVNKLASLSQQLLRSGEVKAAADVLRAAEHLGFGSLAMLAPAETISELLSGALQEEYRHLLERAEEHAASGLLAEPVLRLFVLMKKQAAQAYRAQKYRAASELARGAEALSHVTAEVSGKLSAVDLPRLETA